MLCSFYAPVDFKKKLMSKIVQQKNVLLYRLDPEEIAGLWTAGGLINYQPTLSSHMFR